SSRTRQLAITAYSGARCVCHITPASATIALSRLARSSVAMRTWDPDAFLASTALCETGWRARPPGSLAQAPPVSRTPPARAPTQAFLRDSRLRAPVKVALPALLGWPMRHGEPELAAPAGM